MGLAHLPNPTSIPAIDAKNAHSGTMSVRTSHTIERQLQAPTQVQFMYKEAY
jgi:hypothetical protein